MKLHAIRCVPSLFQYHVFATALSHPDVAKVLATQVDLAVTDAIEVLSGIPIAHSALLGIQTLLPTVLPCRVIIARGHDDHLPPGVRLFLNTGRTLQSVTDEFNRLFNTPPASHPFHKLCRIATEHALARPELALPPVAWARWRSLTGDFLNLHRTPLPTPFLLSVIGLLANPPEPEDLVRFKCPHVSAVRITTRVHRNHRRTRTSHHTSQWHHRQGRRRTHQHRRLSAPFRHLHLPTRLRHCPPPAQ